MDKISLAGNQSEQETLVKQHRIEQEIILRCSQVMTNWSNNTGIVKIVCIYCNMEGELRN